MATKEGDTEASINRQIQAGTHKGWNVDMRECEEGCGMFEVSMRGPDGEYRYKHFTAIEIARMIAEDYE